jgi:hexosaminidase
LKTNVVSNDSIMRKLLIPVLLMAAATMSGQKNRIQVIPQPVEVQVTTGLWTLTGSSTISYSQPESKSVAAMLAQKLNIATGFKLKVRHGPAGAIQLDLNATADPKIGNEGYTLVSSPKKVVITANQTAGLFYGMQTLLQLFPKEIESDVIVKANWTIPAVNITDYPRFAWRGLMLDVSRNFFTKNEVKRYIDEMARFKFNTFHWHLTDDHGWRIEIKSLPKLTEIGAWRVPRAGQFGNRIDVRPDETATDGGFYTQEDIKEIIQYAQERNITIVPEIDIPGHSMAAIASYPWLSCTKSQNTKVNPGTNFAVWYGNGTFQMFIDNTLNPSDEKVYVFLDKVFTEVAQLFPGPYIHVGGDECYKGFWQKDSGCLALMKEQNIRHVEDLQGYFMNHVEKMLTDKGKKLIGWDEILEGGISSGATVMNWRSMAIGAEASKAGHYVVMTPSIFSYLDYTQGDPTVDPPIYGTLRLKKCYSFNPVPEGADAGYILGGQGNLWTEQVATLRHAEYMTWPRGWALAEVFWTPDEKKNWENFVRRVENQFGRSDVAAVKYSRALYDAHVKTHLKDSKMWVEMVSEAPGTEIYYTIDGGMPDRYSPKYIEPFELPEGPVTLRVITYRNDAPLGHLITLKPEDLKGRIE